MQLPTCDIEIHAGFLHCNNSICILCVYIIYRQRWNLVGTNGLVLELSLSTFEPAPNSCDHFNLLSGFTANCGNLYSDVTTLYHLLFQTQTKLGQQHKFQFCTKTCSTTYKKSTHQLHGIFEWRCGQQGNVPRTQNKVRSCASTRKCLQYGLVFKE